jgi:hypothetical protein
MTGEEFSSSGTTGGWLLVMCVYCERGGRMTKNCSQLKGASRGRSPVPIQKRPSRKSGFLDGIPLKGFTLLVAVVVLCTAFPVHAKKGVYDWAFVSLDYARREKVESLQRFCRRIQALAVKAAEDESVVGCFYVNLKYAEMLEKGSVPEDLARTVHDLRESFNRYYIENYLSFYDILFVNQRGEAFYTIRKESDLGKNLTDGDPEKSPLVKCLRDAPRSQAFIDFHDYGPSSKPAAFFVLPMHKDGEQLGWIVLQCAIQKVNTLFAWEEGLGQTGETFLINRHGFMLTESNFDGDSTILRKRLDDRNVQAKFSEKKGHRIVTDYRGRIALTSFEVVEFLGTRWLVVAKVDRDEIITRHYTLHRRYYADRLMQHLKDTPASPLRDTAAPGAGPGLRVDMDEFLKAGDGECLHTFGVSTCTGLVVTYPGRFAYMAHASPRDRIYGAEHTNLLGQVVKQVKSFDIRPCENRLIVFLVVSTHLRSLLPVVDKLIEEGFLLSQILVSCNLKAGSAAMSYDYTDDRLVVTWRSEGASEPSGVHLLTDAVNVGEIIQDIIHAEEGSGV